MTQLLLAIIYVLLLLAVWEETTLTVLLALCTAAHYAVRLIRKLLLLLLLLCIVPTNSCKVALACLGSALTVLEMCVTLTVVHGIIHASVLPTAVDTSLYGYV
jgi:hypothetical protein